MKKDHIKLRTVQSPQGSHNSVYWNVYCTHEERVQG